MKALIVVDMQNDFLTGSLPVPGGLEIVGGISEKMKEYASNGDSIILTMCWHPPNHCSFKEYGGQWPAHCVRFTPGALIQAALQAYADRMNVDVIKKGKMVDRDEYSGFGTPNGELHEILTQRGINELAICGVARNYCVYATESSAIALGYQVTVLEDLCRTV